MKEWIVLLLNLSVSGGILAGIVFLIRLLIRKRAPKAIMPFLWALVGLRLVLPVTLTVAFSPFPASGFLPEEGNATAAIQTETDLQDVTLQSAEQPGNTVSPVSNPVSYAPASERQPADALPTAPVPELPNTGAVTPAATPVSSDIPETLPPAAVVPEKEPAAGVPAAAAVPVSEWLPKVLFFVWIAGVLGMAAYFFISYLRLRNKTREAVLSDNGIYCSDRFSSPFILGLIRPRIYLPEGLSESEKAQVLAHETAHIRRFDHVAKPLSFFILAIHWFNPLVWLAFLCLSRDIEFACDERAIRDLDVAARKNYGATLLKLSTGAHPIQLSPLSFGEVGVKARLTMLFKKQKPSLVLSVLAVVLALGISACFFTAKPTEAPSADPAPTEKPTEVPTEAPTEEPTEVPTEAPTEEANGLTAEFTFDQIYYSAQAKALDSDETAKLVSFLEAEEENRLPRRLPKLFLAQAYRDPSEIDLSILFYDGTEKDVTPEECQAAAEALKNPSLAQFDVEKRTVGSMKELFRKYTGQEPTEKQLKEACSQWIYLEKNDAYYSFFTDTMSVHVEFKRACALDANTAARLNLPAANGDLIALEWTVPEAFRSTMGTATGMILLAPNRNSWTILANYYLPEAPKDLPESVTFDRIYQYVNVQKLTKDEENEILPTLAKVAGSQAVLARACRMDAASAERFKLPVAEGDVIAVEWVIPADRQLLEAGAAAGVILLTPNGEGWDLLATYIVPGYQGPSESDCQPVDPEKWNENLKQTIELGHSHGFRYLDDLEDELDADLVKALKEYERFFSGLYWQHLDLNEFSVLSFSDTVLYDAKRTMEYYKAEAQRAKDVFTYAETNLSHLNIQSQGDMVTIDVKVWTECEYMSPRSLTAGGIFGRGTDHRLVLQKKTDGTFLLVSDSFDERPGQHPSYPAAHSSDR